MRRQGRGGGVMVKGWASGQGRVPRRCVPGLAEAPPGPTRAISYSPPQGSPSLPLPLPRPWPPSPLSHSLEDVQPRGLVGVGELDLAVDAAGPQQRRIQDVDAVGGHEHLAAAAAAAGGREGGERGRVGEWWGTALGGYGAVSTRPQSLQPAHRATLRLGPWQAPDTPIQPPTQHPLLTPPPLLAPSTLPSPLPSSLPPPPHLDLVGGLEAVQLVEQLQHGALDLGRRGRGGGAGGGVHGEGRERLHNKHAVPTSVGRGMRGEAGEEAWGAGPACAHAAVRAAPPTHLPTHPFPALVSPSASPPPPTR